jgi:hypothetical protein
MRLSFRQKGQRPCVKEGFSIGSFSKYALPQIMQTDFIIYLQTTGNYLNPRSVRMPVIFDFGNIPE